MGQRTISRRLSYVQLPQATSRKRSGTVVGGSSANPPISAGGASPHSRIQNESGGMSGFGNAAADTSPNPPFGYSHGQPTVAFSSPPETCLPSSEETSAYLLEFERGSVLAAAARIEKGDFAVGWTRSKDGGVGATPPPEVVY
jgi:hypothetical protein